jgi:hypothetical protein
MPPSKPTRGLRVNRLPGGYDSEPEAIGEEWEPAQRVLSRFLVFRSRWAILALARGSYRFLH